MLVSMTGYGVAEGSLFGNTVKAEIRSLNARYFDFSSRLPSLVTPYESDIKTIELTRVAASKSRSFWCKVRHSRRYKDPLPAGRNRLTNGKHDARETDEYQSA